LTPADWHAIVTGYADTRAQDEKAAWKRTAWLAAQIINISGKYIKRQVKPDDLIQFPDEVKEKEPFDVEKRRREAEETFRFHKTKAWTKIKGASVEDIKLPDVTG